jgi:ferrous iron transport protein A
LLKLGQRKSGFRYLNPGINNVFGGEYMVERIPLIDMETGETGRVVEFFGGRGVHNRLRAMGIRYGIKITKVSAAFGRGPVVLRVGGAQTALGFGISYKIIVEVQR